MKKYFYLLLSIFLILLSFYLFESFNSTPHKLSNNEYSFKNYQLNSQGVWEKFKKIEENLTYDKNFTKEIKSIFFFKKRGTLGLKFFIDKEELKNTLSYKILHNGKQIDSFILKVSQPHEIILNIYKTDKVEILVKSIGKKEYYGKLESSFILFDFFSNKILIAFIWVILFLFLYNYSYHYLAICSLSFFLLNIISERLNFGIVSFEILFAYTFYLFSLLFFLLLIYQLFDKLNRFKIATVINFIILVLFIIPPLLFLLYALNFDHNLTKESLYALFQSNTQESYEYIVKFIDKRYILLAISVYIGVFILLYKQEKVKRKKIDTPQLVFLILIFGTISIISESKYRLNNFIYKHIEEYQKELSLFNEIKAKRKTGQINFEANKEGIAETYIVVIGESLNKNHMGLYGYIRETTPHLSAMKQDLVIYQNSYSNHTHTVPVLSLALTEANQYNKKEYFNSLSIIEVLNKADIDTYWLTNQTLYGAWDNKVSIIATESKNIIALNHTIGCNIITQKYDAVLVDKLKPILEQKSKRNRVIFIHLMGSHSTYSSRYPTDKYSIYTKEIKINKRGIKIKDSKELNYYDNSIYYNDYVVSSILKLLKKEKGIRAFIYFSDHSEDIERDIGHSWEKFTYDMTQIPLIAWFSSEYKNSYYSSYLNFKKHKKELFSNDMIYDTLIGLFRINTQHYKKKYDLTSDEYILKEEEALVLHGKKKYLSPENHLYHSH